MNCGGGKCEVFWSILYLLMNARRGGGDGVQGDD